MNHRSKWTLPKYVAQFLGRYNLFPHATRRSPNPVFIQGLTAAMDPSYEEDPQDVAARHANLRLDIKNIHAKQDWESQILPVAEQVHALISLATEPSIQIRQYVGSLNWI